jgi:predicted ATP-grasp superfamily ATP-dependent carboligase
VERAHQVSMFAIHARACEGALPMEPRPCLAIHGKAIVFARRDTVTRSALRRLGRRWVADIPATGEHIPQGRPICTVFAQARQARACRELLIRRARLIYRAMKSATARAA